MNENLQVFIGLFIAVDLFFDDMEFVGQRAVGGSGAFVDLDIQFVVGGAGDIVLQFAEEIMIGGIPHGGIAVVGAVGGGGCPAVGADFVDGGIGIG